MTQYQIASQRQKVLLVHEDTGIRLELYRMLRKAEYSPWTVNSEKDIYSMLEYGVDIMLAGQLGELDGIDLFDRMQFRARTEHIQLPKTYILLHKDPIAVPEGIQAVFCPPYTQQTFLDQLVAYRK